MQVTFHGIAAGGEGVGRDETGRTVFAPYAAPGDVAQVEINQERPSFARGQIVHLQTASPQRSAPHCPYYLPKENAPTGALTACGGCQIQHLDYAAQLRAKTQLVRDALQRIGGFDKAPVEDCIASQKAFGYRNKAEMFVGEDGAIGYHARRTHQVVDIAACPLLAAPLNELLSAVRAALKGNRSAQRFTLRVDSIGQLAVRLRGPEEAKPARQRIVAALREQFPALLDPHRQLLEEQVSDLRFQVGAFDFFQVNPSLTPVLAQTALQLAGVQNGERALDLFCGSGLFGVFLARAGADVQGVDVMGRLAANARLNGVEARFFKGRADAFLKRALAQKTTYDLVVLDPPREGAAACLKPLVQLAPPRVVYVSCDQATLARDARILASNGYQLQSVLPLDMFPQTAHVETVALLKRVKREVL